MRARAASIVAAIGTVAVMTPVPALAATPALRVLDVEVTETDAGGVIAQVKVRLSAASNRKVTVQYATFNGTAKSPADYTAKTGTLSFPAGTTEKVVKVAIAGEAWTCFAAKTSTGIIAP